MHPVTLPLFAASAYALTDPPQYQLDNDQALAFGVGIGLCVLLLAYIAVVVTRR